MNIVSVIKTKNDSVSPQYTFTDLTDKYGDSLYKFCRSLTYSKEDADDLFQETFLKVFEQSFKLDDWDNPQNFLFSSAVFIWKSWKRKYARRNRIAPVEVLDDSTSDIASQINIEDDFELKEELQKVRELVDNLPENFKVPIILYYTMELDVSEIAETLKIPAGTVKSRLFKARKIIEKGLIEFEK